MRSAELDRVMEKLQRAKVRYILAHNAVVSAQSPTTEQWAELDAAGKEYKRIDEYLETLKAQP